MIVISSFRPHASDGEYRLNQVRANRSWQDIFKRIIYFGDYEAELASPKTVFHPSQDYPTIKEVAQLASQQWEIVALVNADIVVHRNIWEVEQLFLKGMLTGAVSRRYHYDPKTFDLAKAYDDTADRGRDVFIAHPRTWAFTSEAIPSVFRFGHQQWDAFVCDLWRDNFGNRFRDFTHLRFAFHPIHGGRRFPHQKPISQFTGR